MEALTCKSIILTTDAPPMNELVTTERGILCPYSASSLRGVGTNFYVKPAPLAEKVTEMLDLSPSQIESKSENARVFYEESDRQFKQRLLDIFQLQEK